MTGDNYCQLSDGRRASVLAAAVVVVAALLAAPAARAEITVTIEGGGSGHGLGMSQYGAYGRALEGEGPARILQHYYSRSSVTTQKMPRRLRVGLLQSRTAIGLAAAGSGSGNLVFRVLGSSGKVAEGPVGSTWEIQPSPTGGVRLYRDGKQVEMDGRRVFGDDNRPLTAAYQSAGIIARVEQTKRSYSYGRMEFSTYPSKSCTGGRCLRLVLSLAMQKYLYGLSEVPSSWPQSVLEAQAIAGRTYAYEKTVRLGQSRYPCDCAVYDSTIDQAYIGDGKRTGSGEYWKDWKAAVDATKDQVVTYDGAPIQALYSSSSGGHTENNENVWGGEPIPYLRGEPDAADAVAANPNHKWKVTMSRSEFESKLNASYGIGELQDFKLVRPFGVSGRVTVVKPDGTGGALIKGSKKTVRVSGWSLRGALGLKDTLFRVTIEGNSVPPAVSDTAMPSPSPGSLPVRRFELSSPL